ncbi:ATP phosphoribosyltransferase [Geoglobus acetivorans]|uniref:ATP phosphoribosyltransferase n=1 Tax=Geoglobus acetivorans TaxID=565033 RepID=A0A0A7GC43_GEOAI|nr:ATP phosphoribosyltransferase [Geoglobus acetivorans]
MIIALPNKGRLREPAVELLKSAGIKVEADTRRLVAGTNREDISVLFVRAKDIPEYVYKNAAQVGITGLDMVEETGVDVEVLLRLGFGRAKIVVAIPQNSEISSIHDLNGKSIATEFRKIAERFLENNGIDAEIVEVSGACEIAPAMGIADAIIDLTSTGETLRLNNLRVIHEILETEAVLIANRDYIDDFNVQALKTAIESVLNARGMVYLMMNVPEDMLEDVKSVAPGLKGPTVMRVESNGMVAVHVVIHESELFEVVQKLKKAGARDILVIPVQRLIF